MKKHTSEFGATLIEIMLVIVILAVIGAAIALFFSSNGPLFQRSRVRQEVMTQSRICMETIVAHMRNGKARSLVISTPATTPTVQFSRVHFELQTQLPSGATAYNIYLDLPKNTVFTEEIGPGLPNTPIPQILATHVTSLNFMPIDSLDPGIIAVSLRIDAPFDTSNDPTHVSTLILPNTTIHMVETP